MRHRLSVGSSTQLSPMIGAPTDVKQATSPVGSTTLIGRCTTGTAARTPGTARTVANRSSPTGARCCWKALAATSALRMTASVPA